MSLEKILSIRMDEDLRKVVTLASLLSGKTDADWARILLRREAWKEIFSHLPEETSVTLNSSPGQVSREILEAVEDTPLLERSRSMEKLIKKSKEFIQEESNNRYI